jgi:hypothetical protein
LQRLHREAQKTQSDDDTPQNAPSTSLCGLYGVCFVLLWTLRCHLCYLWRFW